MAALKLTSTQGCWVGETMAMPTHYTSHRLCCQLRAPPGVSAHPCITSGECSSLFPLTPLWMCWDQPGLALSPAGLTRTHCHRASVVSEQLMSFNCCKHIPGRARAATGRSRSWEKGMEKGIIATLAMAGPAIPETWLWLSGAAPTSLGAAAPWASQHGPCASALSATTTTVPQCWVPWGSVTP